MAWKLNAEAFRTHVVADLDIYILFQKIYLFIFFINFCSFILSLLLYLLLLPCSTCRTCRCVPRLFLEGHFINYILFSPFCLSFSLPCGTFFGVRYLCAVIPFFERQWSQGGAVIFVYQRTENHQFPYPLSICIRQKLLLFSSYLFKIDVRGGDFILFFSLHLLVLRFIYP